MGYKSELQDQVQLVAGFSIVLASLTIFVLPTVILTKNFIFIPTLARYMQRQEAGGNIEQLNNTDYVEMAMMKHNSAIEVLRNADIYLSSTDAIFWGITGFCLFVELPACISVGDRVLQRCFLYTDSIRPL